MARVVETEEPTKIVEHETVSQNVHEDNNRRSGMGLILAIIIAIILLLLLFWWRPWGGTNTGGANVNVNTPSGGK